MHLNIKKVVVKTGKNEIEFGVLTIFHFAPEGCFHPSLSSTIPKMLGDLQKVRYQTCKNARKKSMRNDPFS